MKSKSGKAKSRSSSKEKKKMVKINRIDREMIEKIMDLITESLRQDLDSIEALIKKNVIGLRQVSYDIGRLKSDLPSPSIICSEFKLFKDDLRFFKGMMKNRMPQSASKPVKTFEDIKDTDTTLNLSTSKIRIMDGGNWSPGGTQKTSQSKHLLKSPENYKGYFRKKKTQGPDISQFLEDINDPQPPRALLIHRMTNDDQAAPSSEFIDQLDHMIIGRSFKEVHEEDLGVNVFPKVRGTRAQKMRDHVSRERIAIEKEKRLDDMVLQLKATMTRRSSLSSDTKPEQKYGSIKTSRESSKNPDEIAAKKQGSIKLDQKYRHELDTSQENSFEGLRPAKKGRKNLQKELRSSIKKNTSQDRILKPVPLIASSPKKIPSSLTEKIKNSPKKNSKPLIPVKSKIKSIITDEKLEKQSQAANPVDIKFSLLQRPLYINESKPSISRSTKKIAKILDESSVKAEKSKSVNKPIKKIIVKLNTSPESKDSKPADHLPKPSTSKPKTITKNVGPQLKNTTLKGPRPNQFKSKTQVQPAILASRQHTPLKHQPTQVHKPVTTQRPQSKSPVKPTSIKKVAAVDNHVGEKASIKGDNLTTSITDNARHDTKLKLKSGPTNEDWIDNDMQSGNSIGGGDIELEMDDSDEGGKSLDINAVIEEIQVDSPLANIEKIPATTEDFKSEFNQKLIIETMNKFSGFSKVPKSSKFSNKIETYPPELADLPGLQSIKLFELPADDNPLPPETPISLVEDDSSQPQPPEPIDMNQPQSPDTEIDATHLEPQDHNPSVTYTTANEDTEHVIDDDDEEYFFDDEDDDVNT